MGDNSAWSKEYYERMDAAWDASEYKKRNEEQANRAAAAAANTSTSSEHMSTEEAATFLGPIIPFIIIYLCVAMPYVALSYGLPFLITRFTLWLPPALEMLVPFAASSVMILGFYFYYRILGPLLVRSVLSIIIMAFGLGLALIFLFIAVALFGLLMLFLTGYVFPMIGNAASM
ncbi:MAG: hypothetical protein AAFR81_10090 [Chloroflexota bacterium]